MSNALFDWIAALIAGALAAGPLPPPAPPPAPPEAAARAPAAEAGIDCRLVVGGDGHDRRIVASATARERPFAGRYELVVRSRGNLTRHRGDFEAAAGETVPLGTLRLSGPASGTIDATLDVVWDGGRSTCRGS